MHPAQGASQSEQARAAGGKRVPRNELTTAGRNQRGSSARAVSRWPAQRINNSFEQPFGALASQRRPRDVG